jgi:UDP-N-acetylmuramate dehydrogenase
MILRNASLKPFNTFGLDYTADQIISVVSEEEVTELIGEGLKDRPYMIVGGGSNVLFIADFKGAIVKPAINEIREVGILSDRIIVSAGAGVEWDSLAEWAVARGYGGAENLSLIPGTVGAVPVQNIGAYGAEASEIINKVKAISVDTGLIREFPNEECRFGYRESIFKKELKNRYIITEVSFSLSLTPDLKTDYGALREEVAKLGAATLKSVREAVINIRRSKLPDPSVTGNAGSFFKNPVVDETVADDLQRKFRSIPVYKDKTGGVKIAAGWLIERCGWKGKRYKNAGVHDKQSLVLVNLGGATGTEIFELSEKIRKSVFEEFGIDLEREVEIIGEPGSS